MSENIENSQQPALATDVYELQGVFPNDAALQEAMGKLSLAGFDHADLSLPDAKALKDTPDTASAATDSIDVGQLRTMASGMTGVAAGMAAGAIVATGGLAAPVVAAIGGASAIGAVVAVSGVGAAVDNAGAEARDRLGAEGKLILAVRIRSPEMLPKAEAAMREAGATALTGVADEDQAMTRGLSSTSWTG